MLDEELQGSLERLSVPMQGVSYEERGSFEIGEGNLKVKVSYSSIENNEKSRIQAFIKETSRWREGGESPTYLNTDTWRRVDSLVIEYEEREIDVLRTGPSAYNIYFSSGDFINGAVMDNEIFIIGGLEKPISLVTLMHEIGHLWDFAKLKESRTEQLVDSHRYARQAEKIREERAANAFALKQMRPFIEDDQRKRDVFKFLSHYAQASYNRGVTGEIVQDQYLSRKVAKDYDLEAERQEEEQRELWDGFEKWKKTQVYQTWKAQPENANVEEFEEFGNWVDWVGRTGYEYWKDLPEEEGRMLFDNDEG